MLKANLEHPGTKDFVGTGEYHYAYSHVTILERSFMPDTTLRKRPVAKKKTSIRITEEADRMLDELEEETGLNRTDIIIQAIRVYFQRETGRKKSREKPEEKD